MNLKAQDRMTKINGDGRRTFPWGAMIVDDLQQGLIPGNIIQGNTGTRIMRQKIPCFGNRWDIAGTGR
jgi:hypothetical protein